MMTWTVEKGGGGDLAAGGIVGGAEWLRFLS